MKENLKYGIGFWLGAGVYSLINMILNLKQVGCFRIEFESIFDEKE